MSISNLNALYSQYPLPIKEQQHRTFLKLFIVMSQSISKALMLICLVLMRILMKILMNFNFCFKTFLAQIPNSTTYFHTYFNIQTLHHRGSTQNCKNSLLLVDDQPSLQMEMMLDWLLRKTDTLLCYQL